ncbi:MAG: tRNA preQ1(34) S-adenosylmethionine ribosyltransferase-isomerase QueA [Desulfobacterales bacterium]|nr:tRNA preQ1(34) S-adenosylmethionine ribosyltransferase-isomerase QueA [Desulfobacterales bacterium]
MYSLTDYDYNLPEELIAQAPVDQRDLSRLLFLDREKGRVEHHIFQDLYDFLLPSDILVINNTEVIPGRLFGRKETGGKLEVLILDYSKGIINNNEYKCLIKASKQLKPKKKIFFDEGVKAEVVAFNDGVYTIKFMVENDFDEILDRIGNVPLPPYIRRSNNDPGDSESYQTVYASQKGAIAAPTAGLHFTEPLIEKIKSKGINIVPVTLHVGYGTFLPVRATDIRDHSIHSEWYSISKESAEIINHARSCGGRIIAVGTTSVRTLENAADDKGNISECSGNCELFIYPGYRFKVINGLVTNFHLPKSTLLMLVSALAGRENILNAYKEAVINLYRFYSYGDAMFIA